MGSHKKSRHKEHYLYLLKDPESLIIKYVGVTHNIAIRNKDRIKKSSRDNNDVRMWLYLLEQKSLEPILDIVKVYDNYDSAHKMEISLIKKFKDTVLNIQHNV